MQESITIMPITLLEKTINEAGEIHKKLNLPSFSDAINQAVDIASQIIKNIDKGNKVIIQGRWGKKYEFIIDGINDD